VTGLCSAHKDGEDLSCAICYPPEAAEPQVGDVLMLGKYLCYVRKITKKDIIVRRIRKDRMDRIQVRDSQ
jgi:hypothetical protein